MKKEVPKTDETTDDINLAIQQSAEEKKSTSPEKPVSPQPSRTSQISKNLLPLLLKILIWLIILFILGYAGWWVWGLVKYQPQATQKSMAPGEDSQALKILENKIQLGNPVSPNEPGFGRADPFSSF